MTDQELKDLVASLAVSQKETDRQIKELRASEAETRASQAELRASLAESQAELRTSLAESQAEINASLAESARQIIELKASQAKTDLQIEEMSKGIAEMKKELGGLGRKFGGFTEGMAFPSMEKILRNKFKMDAVSTNVKVNKKGKNMELDVLAANTDSIYVVEVKSHLKDDGLEQIENILHRFFEFFPHHKGKKLYGILAAVNAPGDIRQRVIKKGIYLARIQDDIFKIQVPDSFTPTAH
ncbi:MAG: DUF3782 domain-containing protein [bacterium]|nr:DUF3782 domain-containing protein [bacterium]